MSWAISHLPTMHTSSIGFIIIIIMTYRRLNADDLIIVYEFLLINIVLCNKVDKE